MQPLEGPGFFGKKVKTLLTWQVTWAYTSSRMYSNMLLFLIAVFITTACTPRQSCSSMPWSNKSLMPAGISFLPSRASLPPGSPSKITQVDDYYIYFKSYCLSYNAKTLTISFPDIKEKIVVLMTNVIFQYLPYSTVSQRDKALSGSKTWEESCLEIHREVRMVDLFQTMLCPTLVLRAPKIRNELHLNLKKNKSVISVLIKVKIIFTLTVAWYYWSSYCKYQKCNRYSLRNLTEKKHIFHSLETSHFKLLNTRTSEQH